MNKEMFPPLLRHGAGAGTVFYSGAACLCHWRRPPHRCQQPVRLHLRHDSGGGHDPAGLGHCAGGPVFSVP